MVTTGPKEFTETHYCCLHTIRYDQPKRLRNVTPAALHLSIDVICYTDMIYMLLVTRRFNWNLAKPFHFTARSVFECIRAGAH
jgi:hypothetical protein